MLLKRVFSCFGEFHSRQVRTSRIKDVNNPYDSDDLLFMRVFRHA